MVGLMFAVGQKTPKLALDLAGGTTVTLTAVTESGKTPPSGSASASPKKRALSSALTQATPTPTASASASPKASASPSPTPSTPANSGNASSVPQSVITLYEKADCTSPQGRKLAGANND